METSATEVRSSDITAQEREDALDYLKSTRDALVASVEGLSPAQLAFKPSPDSWSITEIFEHTAVIANAVAGRITKDLAPGELASIEGCQKKDLLIRNAVPVRTVKVKGPEFSNPTGKVTVPEAIKNLDAACAELAELLKTRGDLRGNFAPHPMLGALDGYQWAMVTAAHTERHAAQVNEVKADPNYPNA